MPFWKRAKPKWIELHHDAYAKFIKSLAEYRTLKNLTGVWADHTIEAMFNKWGGRQVSYMNNPEKKRIFEQGEKATIQHEINMVLAAHYHFGSLQIRARTGSLRGGLRDHPKPPRDYGAHVSDTELWKAAKWITNSSNTLKTAGDDPEAPVNSTKIYNAMDHVVQNMDVRELAALEYLHARLVDQSKLKATRGPSSAVKYCSTGGAGFLQDRAAALAKGISLPPDADVKWDDLACYLLGAHMRAHGFTDGNGRAVRGLFACALLKGGRPFVVPEAAFEQTLHDL